MMGGWVSSAFGRRRSSRTAKLTSVRPAAASCTHASAWSAASASIGTPGVDASSPVGGARRRRLRGDAAGAGSCPSTASALCRCCCCREPVLLRVYRTKRRHSTFRSSSRRVSGTSNTGRCGGTPPSPSSSEISIPSHLAYEALRLAIARRQLFCHKPEGSCRQCPAPFRGVQPLSSPTTSPTTSRRVRR